MKKQGPPPPLDESRITSLKRNKPKEFENNGRGKKRKTSGEVVITTTSKSNKPTSNSVLKTNTKGKSYNSKIASSRKNSKIPRKPAVSQEDVISSDDDAADLIGGGSDIDSDIIDVADIDLQDDDADIQDEFLESGSSVYDSDADKPTAIFSEDEGESDAEEKLTAANIEGLSRRLDTEQNDEAADAQAELEDAALQTNITGDASNLLAEDSDADANSRLAPDLQLLRSRITETVRILSSFSKLAEPNRSRSDYTSQLLKDICLYYGYTPHLAEKLLSLFPPLEALSFFDANESPRPLVLRTNTLRTHRRALAQALINRGVVLEPVGKWSKVGLQVFESQLPLGATPEYLAGHYILQAASSFLPVMALAPQENERILDMAAAPGGKTTHVAALMKNTGCIFANDSNKSRAKALIGNIHRLGAKNTIVCSYDAREFPRIIGGFDRVLLDAPCSGTGVIAKDPSVKTNKTEKDFLLLPHLQKQLLLSAIDSVDHASKTGGYIVYSTCSVTVEENEQVVQYALTKRPNIKLVETGLTFGKEGFVNYMGKSFDQNMKWTRRYYPHSYNVDGFFVSKFRKLGPSPGAAASTDGNGIKADNATTREGDKEVDDGGEFGGWDEEEDRAVIERAEKRRLRRKGIDPKARRGKKSRGGVEEVNGNRSKDKGEGIAAEMAENAL